MPQILEIKEIDGELWCRVGKPGDFPSGIALLTPDEQDSLWNSAIQMAAEYVMDLRIANLIHELKR